MNPDRERTFDVGQIATPQTPIVMPEAFGKQFRVLSLWPLAVLILLIAIGGLLAWQHNYVTDWFVLHDYRPSTPVRQLAQDDTMTAYAKRLFYVNKPQIDSKAAFNAHCSNGNDQVTVLGCFTGNRNGIYVYNVTDPRLAGIEQVTAAHEMLHQAYERLSASEQANVNALLMTYDKTITDPALKAKIKEYQKIEPHNVADEMHSVFGTEVDNLPPQLEKYYSQYFTDRRKITRYHDQYEAVFTQRQQQISSYDSQINSLNSQIASGKAAIASDELSLQNERTQMNEYTQTGQISTYNSMVPGFNSLVNSYTALTNKTNSLISQYNSLIVARNAIATQEQQLEQAINSQASTATQQ